MSLRKTMMAALVTSLSALPAATLITVATGDAAVAKNSNGSGGKGRGNGGGKSNGNGRSADRGKSGQGNSTHTHGKAKHAATSQGGSFIDLNRGNGKARADRGNRSTPVRRSRASTEQAVTRSRVPPMRPGKDAAQLKWLNASKASLNAYVNASPNSRVGQIAAYRAALLDYEALASDPAYQAELDSYRAVLAAYAGENATPEEIDAALEAILALDDDGAYDPAEAEAILADLNPDAVPPEDGDEAYADMLAALDGAPEADNDLQASRHLRDETLATAADGLSLEDGSAAWTTFHDNLRLDQPLPERSDAASDDLAGDIPATDDIADSGEPPFDPLLQLDMN